MASRCIRLTRIHAIQWFGYCDTFDISGNLLIAGRTGAGKSVLMDLVQLVLIGDRRAKYNAASDGRGHTSGRDKKSYCLCDTQEDVDGVRDPWRSLCERDHDPRPDKCDRRKFCAERGFQVLPAIR